MPLKIVRGDITKMKTDAIVNAANETLLGGGGVDGCIHRAAGPALLEECRKLGGCATGSAKITGAGNLPARYVIHAVGPVWRGGGHGERELLVSAYETSLRLAEEAGCESCAFPLISAGVYGYPKDQALSVAEETIIRFLETSEMMVDLVIYSPDDFQIDSRLCGELHRLFTRRGEEDLPKMCCYEALTEKIPDDLERRLGHMDESFSEMLLRKIDEAGITDAACYKRANIDRKLFSKIRSNRLYQPSKATALAFAVALKLPMDETEELLRKAGFALSHARKFDVIVEYFIRRGEYDVYTINNALFACDQTLLGG